VFRGLVYIKILIGNLHSLILPVQIFPKGMEYIVCKTANAL